MITIDAASVAVAEMTAIDATFIANAETTKTGATAVAFIAAGVSRSF